MVLKKLAALTGIWGKKEPQNRQSATLLSFAIDEVATLPFHQKRAFLASYKEQFETLAREQGFETAKIGFTHIGDGDCILNICILDQDFPKGKTIDNITSIITNISPHNIYTKCEQIEYNDDTQQSLIASQTLPDEEPFNIVPGEYQHHFKATINCQNYTL